MRPISGVKLFIAGYGISAIDRIDLNGSHLSVDALCGSMMFHEHEASRVFNMITLSAVVRRGLAID